MNGAIEAEDALGEDVNCVEVEEKLNWDMSKVGIRTKMKPQAIEPTRRPQQPKIERAGFEPRRSARGQRIGGPRGCRKGQVGHHIRRVGVPRTATERAHMARAVVGPRTF
jgi:hypothetical protein